MYLRVHGVKVPVVIENDLHSDEGEPTYGLYRPNPVRGKAGTIVLDHGAAGLTQFADSNGSVSVTTLTQNGYAAGKYTSVAIDDSGRVVATYVSGRLVHEIQR